MMPHHRPVQFCRDQQLLKSDRLASVTPFIYSPLHLSPARSDNTSAQHGYIICTSLFFFCLLVQYLFILMSDMLTVKEHRPCLHMKFKNLSKQKVCQHESSLMHTCKHGPVKLKYAILLCGSLTRKSINHISQ